MTCPRCQGQLAQRMVAGTPALWCFACSREVAPNGSTVVQPKPAPGLGSAHKGEANSRRVECQSV